MQLSRTRTSADENGKNNYPRFPHSHLHLRAVQVSASYFREE